MECKYFERMIPQYFKDELEEEDLRDFLEHIDTCVSCKEELSIQYLIGEGMQRLEDGNTFDIQKELKEKLEYSAYRNNTRRRWRRINYAAELAIILIVVGLIVWFVFF